MISHRIETVFSFAFKISEIADFLNKSNGSAHIDYAVFKLCIQDCFQEPGEKEKQNELIEQK